MAESFINPATVLGVLLMLLSGGVRDLVSCLSTDTYWKAKNVTVSVERLQHELDPIQPADVSKLINDLDADDPKTRDEASAKIAAVGPAAIPGLTESAKTGSPEVAARSSVLLARIRANATAASVRRLMAIRTLGEKKDSAALPTLQTMLDSKQMFEADYARCAIAKIEGKPYQAPVASDQDRALDVGTLPARLDIVAQIAPQFAGEFSVGKILDQMPMPDDQKNKSRDEANAQILKALETVGNVRLDCVTWGFFAAPPTQPGNTMVIVRGLFDQATVAGVLTQALPNVKKVNDVSVVEIDENTAVLLPGDGRIALVSRESSGDMQLEQMTLALRKGAGDFSTNADLTALVKSIDAKAPLWAVTKLSPGLKEIAGPLGDFDTATLVGTQTLDQDKITTNLTLTALSQNPQTAKQAAAMVSEKLRQAVEEGRKEEKNMPVIKPMVDFVEAIKVSADGGKATATGSLKDAPILPMMFVGSVQAVQAGAPNPPPAPILPK